MGNFAAGVGNYAGGVGNFCVSPPTPETGFLIFMTFEQALPIQMKIEEIQPA